MTKKLLLWTLVFLIIISNVLGVWVVDDLRDEATISNIDWDLSNAEVSTSGSNYYIHGNSPTFSGGVKSGNISFDLFNNATFLFRANNSGGYNLIFGLGANNYDYDFEYSIYQHQNSNTYVELPSITYAYPGISTGLKDWLFQFNYYDSGVDANKYVLNVSYKSVIVDDDFGDLTGFTPLLANVTLNSSDVDNYSLYAKAFFAAHTLYHSQIINFSYNISDGLSYYKQQNINITFLDTKDLVVYYTFDDENTTNNGSDVIMDAWGVNDGSLGGYNGTLESSITTGEPGLQEESYLFAWGGGAYLSFDPNSIMLNRTTSFWIKPKSVTAEDRIINDANYGIMFWIRNVAGKQYFQAFYGSTGDVIVTGEGEPPYSNYTLDRWTLVTSVYDYTTGNKSLFLNGSRVNESMGTAGRVYNNGSTKTYLGKTGSYSFKGNLDNFVMWNRTLNDYEIKYLYFNGDGGNATDGKAIMYYNYSYPVAYADNNFILQFNITNTHSVIDNITSTLYYDNKEVTADINYSSGDDFYILKYNVSNAPEGYTFFDAEVNFNYLNDLTYTTNLTENFYSFPVHVDNCSIHSTYVLKFHFFEENATTNFINSTMEVNLEYGTTSTNLINNYSTFLLGQPDNWSICIEPSNASVYANIYIAYYPKSNDGFTHRYYAYNTTLSNDTQNITLYNFNDTSGVSDLRITIRNTTSYTLYPNILGKLERFYVSEGVWRNVQHSLSDDYGLLFFNIEQERVDYRIRYYDQQNNLLSTSTSLKFSCDIGICEVTYLLTPHTPSSVVDDVLYSQVFENSSWAGQRFWHLNWSDPEGDTRTIYTLVTHIVGSSNIPICSFTQTGSSGNVTCNLTAYYGTAFVDVNVMGSNESIFWGWLDLKHLGLSSVLDEREAAFWVFFIMACIVAFGLWSPVGSIVMTGVGLGVIYFLGVFAPLTFTFILVACIISIIIGVVVKK